VFSGNILTRPTQFSMPLFTFTHYHLSPLQIPQYIPISKQNSYSSTHHYSLTINSYSKHLNTRQTCLNQHILTYSCHHRLTRYHFSLLFPYTYLQFKTPQYMLTCSPNIVSLLFHILHHIPSLPINTSLYPTFTA